MSKNFDRIKKVWLNLEESYLDAKKKKPNLTKVEFVSGFLRNSDGSSRTLQMLSILQRSCDTDENFDVVKEQVEDYELMTRVINNLDKALTDKLDIETLDLDHVFQSSPDTLQKFFNRANDKDVGKSNAFKSKTLRLAITEVPKLRTAEISAEQAFKEKIFFSFIESGNYVSIETRAKDLYLISSTSKLKAAYNITINDMVMGSASEFDKIVHKYIESMKQADKNCTAGLYFVGNSRFTVDGENIISAGYTGPYTKVSSFKKTSTKLKFGKSEKTYYLHNYTVYFVDRRSVDNTYGVFISCDS